MKMNVKEAGMGFIQAENDRIVLAGGMRCGNSPADVTRKRFIILDVLKYNELQAQGAEQSVIDDKCNVGIVDLFIKDGTKFDVKGLVNIEIKKEHRKNGLAREVLNGIRHTTGQSLEIHDIKKHVASVWRKLGVETFHNGHGRELKVSKVSAKTLLNGTMPPIEPKLENTIDDNSLSM